MLSAQKNNRFSWSKIFKVFSQEKTRKIMLWILIPTAMLALTVSLAMGFFLNQDKIINFFYYRFHTEEVDNSLYIPDDFNTDSAEQDIDSDEEIPSFEEADPGQTKEADHITISAVGDLAVHQMQLDAAFNETDGSYDFSDDFSAIAPYLAKSDLVIGDLYTTISGDEVGYSGYPLFNSPKSFLTALRKAHFNVLITSNNRAFDHGWLGVSKTIQNIKTEGMRPVGTYLDADAYYQPDILDVSGFKVAVLAYTESVDNTGDISRDKQSFCIKLINIDTILRDVQAAKKEGAEIIVVSLHWGTEDTREPNSKCRGIAEELLENGVDLIIGTHPQMLQSITYREFNRKDGTKKNAMVAYSLGNFISNKRNRYNDTGMILSVDFQRNAETGDVAMSGASVTPTWIYAADTETPAEKDFKVLPLWAYINDETLSSELYPAALDRMKKAMSEFEELINNKNITINKEILR